MLRTTPGSLFFQAISGSLLKIMDFAGKGTRFAFGPLFDSFTHIPGYNGRSFVFVLGALVPIIFFGGLISLLYHFGIMQRVVRFVAWGFMRLFGLSGPDATAKTTAVTAESFNAELKSIELGVILYLSKNLFSTISTKLHFGGITGGLFLKKTVRQ